MSKEEAIKFLVDALEASNKAGVFTLTDATKAVQAINKLSELVEIVPSKD